jgi:glucosamine-6-phosphate deaminase
MQVIIRPTSEDAVRIVARLVARTVIVAPDAVLGLATGSTMEKVYEQLGRMHKEEGLDFSLVRTFNLDEYVGLAPDDPHSYHQYMETHLFSRINIDRRNTHLLDGMAQSLNAECARYEALIKRCGGIDLQLLGIGQDGHIGFNEPMSALYSRTREKSLTPTTIAQNARYFKDASLMPHRALTMGVGTILDCKRLVLLATGYPKADVLSKAVEGPISSMVTATAIQLHPSCRVVTDDGAGSLLKAREYYDWIFANEPEWEEFRKQV